MIDFYKHSLLSVLGKGAGSMSETEYVKKLENKYDEYLEKLKKMKKIIEESENNNNNNGEIYL